MDENYHGMKKKIVKPAPGFTIFNLHYYNI